MTVVVIKRLIIIFSSVSHSFPRQKMYSNNSSSFIHHILGRIEEKILRLETSRVRRSFRRLILGTDFLFMMLLE